MSIQKILCAASLAVLSAVPVQAHHEAAGDRQYLAFWGGFRPALDPVPTPETCRDGVFWEKGFISIYSQGAE